MTTFVIMSAILFTVVMIGYVKLEEIAEKKEAAKRAAEKSAKFRAMLKEARKERAQKKQEEYYKNHPGEKLVAELFGITVLEPVVRSILGK